MLVYPTLYFLPPLLFSLCTSLPSLLCRFRTFVSLLWLLLFLLPCCPRPALFPITLSSNSLSRSLKLSISLWFLLQLTGGCCCFEMWAFAWSACHRWAWHECVSVCACVCVRECVWQSKSANSFRKHLSGALCWWFMTARERDRETARQTARNGIESEIERGEWERFVRELEWESVRAFG